MPDEKVEQENEEIKIHSRRRKRIFLILFLFFSGLKIQTRDRDCYCCFRKPTARFVVIDLNKIYDSFYLMEANKTKKISTLHNIKSSHVTEFSSASFWLTTATRL